MLSATGYAVLGLLSFGEALSGYDLKRWADHSLRYYFASPAQSAIYTELRRIEELGLVEAVGAVEGPRGRQRYRITESGRAALAAWVGSEPTPPTMIKDHALLKLAIGHVASPDTVRAVIAAEQAAAQALLEQVRYSATRAEVAGLGYVGLVERCCERLAAARVEAFRDLADALAEGVAPLPDDADDTARWALRRPAPGQRPTEAQERQQ
ncbi:PadR family transcriptional regulator [Frankia sp. AgKG'84/4]|uniref:PadR family transcriptional regulator n=1 Tax=Frankia sp. AgKG'84/4 TaxID=573490 RepID=UPI00200EE430|nr:PadR family transcriptional regulator [Frankia sp. AgKG'84/4]MCL9794556.1 PadR family transcriptional regulator [Frankia sp. AgKG'84/4]